METTLRVSERRRAFEELYAAHGRAAVHLGYLLTGNMADAEDLAHEAFVRVIGRFGNLRKPDAFRAYLMRSIVNLAKSEFRRREVARRKVPTLVSRDRSEIPDLETRDELAAALARLPHRQRAAVVLRFCEDLSEQATADVMGTSVKAVKALSGRGLKALREQEGVSHE
jgi:RNA polymerase sigma-70 factor (sigma-E family)